MTAAEGCRSASPQFTFATPHRASLLVHFLYQSNPNDSLRSSNTGDSGELLLSACAFGMATPEVHHLFHHPIADHSFSADKKTLAVARDNNIELYSRSGNRFTLQDELKGHDKTVTSVDIAPTTGRIVTCSQGMTTF